MPYEWITRPSTTGSERNIVAQLHLWPYRSLPRKGFVLFIAATSGLLSLPLFVVLGTSVLWVLLPFLALAVIMIWIALNHSYRSGEILETLTITPDHISLTHTVAGRTQSWTANSYWAELHCRDTGGPVENYLTFLGGPREVELGRFLTSQERRALFDDIRRKLAQAKAPR
ncbi:hypothetical protein BFP70_15455 [Thioclava sp. SK-1]|uniref:DUF2244 domain-containing protein n=1 Tax=Thioclava sp. SK-1 TaxID=1889770 RepID=UPI000824B89B|nr:DUF2244 domain-containing protein [Thioclava sp. SK-1]OCX61419.1 hypothetical protein BFP70_15455 [Thioclava sp. SK-1]